MIQDLATSDELTRTTFQLLICTLDHGIGRLPEKIRRSEEARKADDALGAANDFLVNNYDPKLMAGAIEQLRQGLVPLAARGYGPFTLYVLTRMKRKRRGARSRTVIPFPLTPRARREPPEE